MLRPPTARSTTTPASGKRMTQSDRVTVREIIDFCNSKWVEAHQAESVSTTPSPEHTARKAAFDEVMSFARSLLDARIDENA